MTGVIDDARSPHGLFPDGDLPRTSFETPHASPLDWARRRRSDRDSRRGELASGRAATRLARLGEGWKVLDIQEIGLLNPNTFLAIGPGGVFVIVVKQQGRSRVRLAGDVVQIDGKRPQYIAEAKRVAQETSKALSRTAGNTIPVTPIVAFAGTGAIDVHGLPRGCIVTPYRELDHLLSSYGQRIGPVTVQKLYSVARHPVTWVDSQSDAESYIWYTSQPSTIKRSA